MAISTVAGTLPGCNGSKWLKVSEASALYGVCDQTIRNLVGAGELQAVRTAGGHRRIPVASLRSYFEGVSEDEQGEGNGEGIAAYVRVSSEKQNAAGSLERQRERLLQEVASREGLKADAIAVYSDVASSFGSRDGMNKLVDDIIDGKIRKVYCEYLDRLSRVPGLTHLLNHLCKRYGVEVIALDLEDTEDGEIYQKELLGFLTVWCNRQSAMKSRKVTVKGVSADALTRMVALRQKGLTLIEITKRLEKEGFKTSHGDAISYCLVRKYIDANGNEEVLSHILVDGGFRIEESIKRFVETCIRKVEGSEISTPSIYPAYTSFCKRQDVKPQPCWIFGRAVVKILGKHSRKSRGVRLWSGYAVN
jgi:putative resolvase